jgi:ERCC4-related helicase
MALASSLKDYPFKINYGPQDDRVRDFYVPALSRSVRYERSSGFFSSTSLSIASRGVAHLIRNKGRMRLLVGAKLSEQDVKAIKKGHDLAGLVSQSMLAGIADLEKLIQNRIQGLTWMVAEKALEIKVVLPSRNGIPLSSSESHDYYHPKEALFTDLYGDQIGFNGSVNESGQGWENNYETFMIYRSWDDSAPYLKQIKYRFDYLWNGREKDWIALDIPTAVRQRLLDYAPSRPPEPEEEKPPEPTGSVTPQQRERIIFQFLRDAPNLPNGDLVGQETATVDLWPHQKKTVNDVVNAYPSSFMFCSEVGLGKTIEAGMALRKLIISGKVKRCLILTPKSVSRQWQEELYEKMCLNVPLYDRGGFTDYFKNPLPLNCENIWDEYPIFIASSQLAKRKEQHDRVLAAKPWDVVIIDEAHHARRKDFLDERRRPNRLLELIEGTKDLEGLVKKTKCLFLLTATPMQVHPVEVWDLTRSLGMGGRWEASEYNYLEFFSELKKPFEKADWDFVINMFKDSLAGGTTVDEQFKALVHNELGPVVGDELLNIHTSLNRKNILKNLSSKGQSLLVTMIKQFTPLKRLMKRSTRRLLRAYKEKGLLTGSVPKRHSKPEWIQMDADERELYERIEEYISDFYQKYEEKRKGLGFIMTVYRRRLTSSFYAVEKSLERRLEFLRSQSSANAKNDQPAGKWLADEDLEQEDLDQDISDEIDLDPVMFEAEIKYVEDFLHEIRLLKSNSKWKQLHHDIKNYLNTQESLVIFTQYTDTMDYLRDQLRQVYGSAVACYSGRGGELWNGVDWTTVSKEEIKNLFRKAEQIKILLCTEAASEGLNLQTSGVLINYDMPWNPMRAEQRIGRIDRIGGHENVFISNYFYADTVEAKIYQALSSRINWFEWVVGELQPILSSVAKTIQEVALTQRDAREERLQQAIADLNKKYDDLLAQGLDLDEYLVDEVEEVRGQCPVTLKDLESTLTQSPSLKSCWASHADYPNAWTLHVDETPVGVTFDRELFDEHPETVRLVTYGSEILTGLMNRLQQLQRYSDLNAPLIRCSTPEPVSLVGYYKVSVDAFTPISTFHELEDSLNQLDFSPTQEIIEKVRYDFITKVNEIQTREVEKAKTAMESKRLALEESGRILLAQAGYIHIVRTHQMIDGEDQQLSLSLFGDTDNMIGILRTKKFPYAGLLTFPALDQIRLHPEDRFYQSIRNEQERELKTIEENIKSQARTVLNELVELGKTTLEAGTRPTITVDCFFPTPN